MPVRRRVDKRRDALDAHTIAWLNGDDDSGFVQFKPHEELLALWEAYGDPDVAEWDLNENSKPRAS
jgi:hypothetical protein